MTSSISSAMVEYTCVIISARIFGWYLVFDQVLVFGGDFVVVGVACFIFFFFLFVLLFEMTGNCRSLVVVDGIVWLLLRLSSLLGGVVASDVRLAE